jgi:hypothetical protein
MKYRFVATTYKVIIVDAPDLEEARRIMKAMNPAADNISEGMELSKWEEQHKYQKKHDKG